MKKAIILLVTLFFIMVISLSVIKNLDKSEALIRSSNENHIHTQLLLLLRSYQDEIAKLLANNEKSLDDIIFDSSYSQPVLIEMENIKSSFELIKLEELYNINDIFSEDAQKEYAFQQFILQQGIDYEDFKSFITQEMLKIDKELKGFSNKKQINQMLDAYDKRVELFYKQELKKALFFMDFSENKKYVLCNLNLELYNKAYSSHIIYDMQTIQNNKARVIDFEIIFK